jgi:6-phosphogluconolactonase (cycloisomerase 2 family)
MGPPHWIRTCALLACAALGACGGGGGGGGVPAPGALSYPDALALLVVELDVVATAPSYSGQVDHFVVVPPLPEGLELDATTGAIRGTPRAVTERRAYRVTASNAGGSTECELQLAVVAAPRFAYALSGVDSSITIFGVDAEDGHLRRRGYRMPPPGENGAEQLVLHPSERFLYVPNTATENISVYAIDPHEGWLTSRASAGASAGPHRIAFRPDGRFAYVVASGADELLIYDVDLVSGELVLARAPLPTAHAPSDVAIDPQGRFLFLASTGALPDGQGGVQAYAIDPFTGDVTPSGSVVRLEGMFPTVLQVDPVRNALYVTLAATDSVLPIRFHQTTGALYALGANSAGDLPQALSIDPLGRFTFVLNENSASVSSYVVDDESGELIQSSTTSTGALPAGAEMDTAGRYLYVVNAGSNDVLQYAIAPADGSLALLGGWAVRPGPVDFRIVCGDAPALTRTRFLHVANAGSGDVSAYTVPPEGGTPTETLPTTPIGTSPIAIALHPRHPFAYVADRDARTLSAHTVDGADGRLTLLPPAHPTTGQPWSLALDPSGRFLYTLRRHVEELDDGWLSTHALDVTDGSLHFVADQPVGPRPTYVGIEPSGIHLYVANIGAPSSIQAFRLDALTGLATASAPPSPAPGVHALAFHPSGRSLHAVLRTSQTLVQYALDPTTGQPIAISGGARSGRDPVALAFTPDGRHAYAAYEDIQNLEDGGHLSHFRVDPTGRLETPSTPYQDGQHPAALLVTPCGRYVHAVNAGTNTLSTLALDPTTGQLLPLPSTPTGLNPRALAATGTTP